MDTYLMKLKYRIIIIINLLNHKKKIIYKANSVRI